MVSPSTLYATVLAKLKAIEPTASFNVTHYTLSLGDANASTGWFEETYSEGATIEVILVTKATQQTLTGSGFYVRLDTLALTLTAVAEGDKIKDANDLYYKVISVKPQPFGDVNVLYVADLTYLSMES